MGEPIVWKVAGIFFVSLFSILTLIEYMKVRELSIKRLALDLVVSGVFSTMVFIMGVTAMNGYAEDEERADRHLGNVAKILGAEDLEVYSKSTLKDYVILQKGKLYTVRIAEDSEEVDTISHADVVIYHDGKLTTNGLATTRVNGAGN